jgi:hydroxymethylglutaryl-CoA lyase
MTGQSVEIIEVGPRDGLQSQSQGLSTLQKKEWIVSLIHAGFKRIEVGSFVSPKAVPAMADTAELLSLLPHNEAVSYMALVANQRGLDQFLASTCNDMAVFTAVSDSFCEKNINTNIQGSLERFAPLVKEAKESKKDLWVRAYVSCVFACPYEGQTALEKLWPVADALFEMGCDELSIGDTLGQATESQTEEIYSELAKRYEKNKIVAHFHDSSGGALKNIEIVLDKGFKKFDSSAGGLGGCPYAPGAPGNVASDDLNAFLNSRGIKSGIDSQKLQQSSELLQSFLKEPLPSKHFQQRKG